jgi:hypothetical protein
MKKLSFLFIVVFLVSCGSTAIKNIETRPLNEILTQQADGGGNIHFYEILTEPNEIKMLQNDKQLKNKISTTDVQKSNFVILNMGEKSSGGYSITIESIEETDSTINIKVKENSPEPDAMVTQGITYPFCVIKINSKKEIFIK